MRNKSLFILAAILFSTLANIDAQTVNKLFYKKPAKEWTEALPIGNGRLGAMIYGGVPQEHIQFNEETLWTGGPHDYTHKGAGDYLCEIRALLFEGKQKEAQDLARKVFMSEPIKQMAYQPFGDLLIDFPGQKNYSDYVRELNIDKAICTVSYSVNGVKYKREIFASKPDDVIAVRLTTDKPGALNFTLALNSVQFLKSVHTENNTQTLSVKIVNGKMEGMAGLKVFSDGEINPDYRNISVKGASTATIYLSAYTNFVNFRDVSERPKRFVNWYLKQYDKFEYEKVKAKHIADYQSLFNRFHLNFTDNGKSAVPTNERIYDFWQNPDDPELVALYVQYARYLMISSSRPGGQPANLQGIWNQDLQPAWESKWTTNINTEMNYWPVEETNLSECHQPLFKLIDECSQTGAIVAKEQYHCDGWVLHHNTDIWRGAAPIDGVWGIWVTGGAWLCTHLWEHYLFTQDKKFLAEKYPVIKKAALFFTEFLVKDPKTGYLISTPSNSPEIGGLVAGPTMDHEIIRALFGICIKASDILNTDADFANKLKKMLPQIAPYQIGKYGQLQEWMEDKDDPTVTHRHVSHLWAVYPGHELNWEQTPKLMKAARQSLIFRGDGGTGWSLAWKVNFWARFRDGNHAYKLLDSLLSPALEPRRTLQGGTLPNMFDAHPPFQIDGNFGGAAGVVEMLIQSELGKIELLPALPDALSTGSISGVCARGGFELSYNWENGKLKNVEVLSKAGNACILKYNDKVIDFPTEKGKTYTFDGKLKRIT